MTPTLTPQTPTFTLSLSVNVSVKPLTPYSIDSNIPDELHDMLKLETQFVQARFLKSLPSRLINNPPTVNSGVIPIVSLKIDAENFEHLLNSKYVMRVDCSRKFIIESLDCVYQPF